MSIEAELSPVDQPLGRAAPAILRSSSARYAGGVILLAVAYYGAAKVGQTLRYTGSVAAIWPPAGLGIAALYLWGLRWWPGVFLGELFVNAELLADETALPLDSVLGQWVGNMAEIVVGAVLLRRLIGPRAGLDRVGQVAGMLAALGIATAISATVGTMSMLAGGVIEQSDIGSFWRTWWLGDTAGGVVVLPLILAWAHGPAAAWRRICTWEGALLIAAVAVLSVIAVWAIHPVTYVVFPALIWAAFRFGPPGATLSIAIAAGVGIGLTAHRHGVFFTQPIDDRTLSTQVYVVVIAVTTLFLTAVVSERRQAATDLAEAKRSEGERALGERHRIARDLHDSVSQALFSTSLHTRTAQTALAQEGVDLSGALGRELRTIGELTRSAQHEMRALIFELGHDTIDEGLVAALEQHASKLETEYGVTIDVQGPESRLVLSAGAETQLFAIGREALVNVVKHAGASAIRIRVEARRSRVALEIWDNGRGFDPGLGHPGHFGLDSMRSRATEIGGFLTITSAPGQGTVVRAEVPTEREGASDDT